MNNSGAIIIFLFCVDGRFYFGILWCWGWLNVFYWGFNHCVICYDDFLGGQNVWQKSYHAMKISTSLFFVFLKSKQTTEVAPLLTAM